MNETYALVQGRFGNRMLGYFSALEEIGVKPDFFTEGSYCEPVKLAKWFGTIGGLLTNGDILTARARGPDKAFWFSK